MLLLKKNDFEISVEGARVSAAEAATVAAASDVFAAAEAEAKEIIDQAKKDAENEKRRGYEEGLAEGREQIMMQKLDMLDESVRYLESIENKVAELVLKALGKCIAEIDAKELVTQIVRKSMQAVVRNQRQITIKVAPEMVAPVKERIKTILEDFPSVAYADVTADEHLKNDGCVVETESGIVEASVEGQLAAIEKSIRKAFAKEK